MKSIEKMFNKKFPKEIIRILSGLSIFSRKPRVIIISNFAKNELLIAKALEAVIIPVDQKFKTDKVHQLMKLSFKFRFLVIHFKFSDLINYSEPELRSYFLKISEILNILDKIFHKKVKLYIEFGGIDRITGHTVYFQDKLNLRFGICITRKNFRDLNQELHSAYDALVDQIDHNFPSKISKLKYISDKQKLYLFKEQIEYVKPYLINFVSKIVSLKLERRKFHLNGIYFSSNNKANCTTNLLPELLSHTREKTFHKKSRYLEPTTKTCQSTLEIIFQDNTLSKNYLFKIIYNYKWFFTNIVLIILFLSLILVSWHEYLCEKKLAHYAIRANKLLLNSSKNSTENSLKSISTLLRNVQLLNLNPVPIRLLPISYQLESGIHKSLNKIVSSIIYNLFPVWFKTVLNENHIDLKSRFIATQAYRSLELPQKYHYLINAICYFLQSEYVTQNKPIAHCSNLRLWLNPKFVAIRHKLLKSSIAKIMEYPIPERVYASFYLSEYLKPKNSLQKLSKLLNKYKYIYDEAPSNPLLTIFSKSYQLNLGKILKLYHQDSSFLSIDEDIEMNWSDEEQNEFNRIYLKNLTNYWKYRLSQLHLRPVSSLHEFERLSREINSGNNKLSNLIADLRRLIPRTFYQNLHEAEDFDYEPLSSWLSSINRHLLTISKESSPGKVALELLKKTYSNPTASLFYPAVELAKNSPYPINLWVQELYKQAWLLLTKLALTEINTSWKNTVVPIYKAFIKGHYPLTNSSLEISLADFHNFFGPHQIIDNFFKKNLADFFDVKLNAIELKQMGELTLTLKLSEMDFWNIIFKIKNSYFNQNSSLPEFKVYLKPIELSKNSRILKLNLGNYKLSYRHGPQFNTEIKWPFPDDKNLASLKLIDFSNYSNELDYSGPWSFFHFFDSANLNRREGTSIELFYKINNQSCRFLISQPLNHSYLDLTEFRKFNFPFSFNLVSAKSTQY